MGKVKRLLERKSNVINMICLLTGPHYNDGVTKELSNRFYKVAGLNVSLLHLCPVIVLCIFSIYDYNLEPVHLLSC